MEEPKTRREKKGGKKDKKGPYSAKHVRLAVAVAGASAAKPVALPVTKKR